MKTVTPAFNDIFNNDSDVYASHKLVCEFGSNRFNDGQVVTASSTKDSLRSSNQFQTKPINFWRAEDAFNDKNHNTMRWLVCDAGATVKAEEDGEGPRCMNLDTAYDNIEHGWWAQNRTNTSGIYSTPEWVQSVFAGRMVSDISLYMTEGYPNMKEVSVEYRNSSGTWIPVQSNRTLGTNEYEVHWAVSNIMIYGLRATVHSTYRPRDRARLSELNAYLRMDVSEHVVNMDIRETRENYEDSTVPIGTLRANAFNFTLDNTQGLFNPDNAGSPYSPYIGENVRVIPYLGVDLNKGVGTPNYEYIQMGEFWTDDFDVDGSGTTASASCRDYSKFMQDEEETVGYLWKKNNIAKICRDVLARCNIPSQKINIDDAHLRVFDAVYIKDQSYWDFMSEICFADQGIFGFDHFGEFFFHSYDRLDRAPYNIPTATFSWDKNIADGSVKTTIYLNKAVVKSTPVEERIDKLQSVWSPPDDDILQWSRLGSAISATQTTIPVKIATNQENANLTDNNWHEENGIIFLPLYDLSNDDMQGEDPEMHLIGGELIRYKSRTDSAFTQCERGFLGTKAQAWPENKYIGEARYYEMEFDKAPVTRVRWPFVTAIDFLQQSPDEGTAQAAVVLFEHDAFVGKLCIANLVNYRTWIEGTGNTYKDYRDDSINYSDMSFNTSISGVVITEKAGKELINGEVDEGIQAENKDNIRRYGLNKIEIDNKWIQDKRHAQQIVNILINEYKRPRDIVELEILPNPAISTGDRVTIQNYPQLSIVNQDYHVIDVSYDYDGGIRGRVTLREVRQD